MTSAQRFWVQTDALGEKSGSRVVSPSTEGRAGTVRALRGIRGVACSYCRNADDVMAGRLSSQQVMLTEGWSVN